jgi:hypothetical protein
MPIAETPLNDYAPPVTNRADIAFGCGLTALGVCVCLSFLVFDSLVLLAAWLIGVPMVIAGLITVGDGIWGRLGAPEARASPVARQQLIPPETKRQVWARDRGTCVLCGAGTDLRFSYLIPESEGGNDASNIRVLCGRCELDIAAPGEVKTEPAAP